MEGGRFQDRLFLQAEKGKNSPKVAVFTDGANRSSGSLNIVFLSIAIKKRQKRPKRIFLSFYLSNLLPQKHSVTDGLIVSAGLFKHEKQVIYLQVFLLLLLQVDEYITLMHHHKPVAVFQGILHVMGNH